MQKQVIFEISKIREMSFFKTARAALLSVFPFVLIGSFAKVATVALLAPDMSMSATSVSRRFPSRPLSEDAPDKDMSHDRTRPQRRARRQRGCAPPAFALRARAPPPGEHPSKASRWSRRTIRWRPRSFPRPASSGRSPIWTPPAGRPPAARPVPPGTCPFPFAAAAAAVLCSWVSASFRFSPIIAERAVAKLPPLPALLSTGGCNAEKKRPGPMGPGAFACVFFYRSSRK